MQQSLETSEANAQEGWGGGRYLYIHSGTQSATLLILQIMLEPRK